MAEVMMADQAGLKKAAEIVRGGGIVVVPTLTIYVLVCDAMNKEALAKLRRIRKSPADKPITVVMDKERIGEFAVLDDRQRRIIDLFSPSPVSMYVQKKEHTPLDEAAAGSDALVVYFQDSPVRDLYEESGIILAITSSNLKGLPDAMNIDEAVEYFGDEVDLYLDGGPAAGSNPSPHIDIRVRPVISRREAFHFPFSRILEIMGRNGLE